MRSSTARIALSLCLGAAAVSCSDGPTTVQSSRLAPKSAVRSTTPAYPIALISQVYGGGGNSGATLTNDFVELFNPGVAPLNVDGWSVQYASAKGTSWQVTALSGSIAPGAYYLVQEAAGNGGTTALPTPDASGSIAMSGTSGKVALVASTTPLSGDCPATPVDVVIFGTATSVSACTYPPTGHALSNTTAAIRGDNGCAYTANAGSDFTNGAPNPRNATSTPRGSCPGTVPAGPLDHVTIDGPNTVTVGTTIQLAASTRDANNQTVTDANVTWSSSDQSVATVDAAGKVTGVSASPTPVTITATAVEGDITKNASVRITVSSPAIHWIDVSSSSASFPPGFQTQTFATARVSSGGTIVPANFTFEAVDPQIATIANAGNTGIITGVSAPTDGSKPGFRIIATPLDGSTPPDTFVTHAITIEQPTSAPASIYGTNDEFGDPTAASASNPNDLLIARPQYALSYNESHGTPNWVSYELDARQMQSGQDRCNCFTADPTLPPDKRIFTSDYTSGGYDRGHMTRSADRTAANVDNATTFYLTNVVPQMADLNQGVWAQFE
ncbi:MAG TPA: DNA/RNA non-specific endonuclease, partial [Gemmatimonadaceae bacterium]|nr:DNA/RNA non-specific endonuclease [Gemmatimonadaceae bacterium]